MSSVLSNQSVVLDGVNYEEVYPSGHVDQESPGEDRSLFASFLSSTNEDMEMAKPVEVFDDGEEQTDFYLHQDSLGLHDRTDTLPHNPHHHERLTGYSMH